MRGMWLCGALLVAACAGKGDDTDGTGNGDTDATKPTGPTDDTTTPAGTFDAVVTTSDLVPNVQIVTWTPPAGGASYVEYGLADADTLDLATPEVAGDGPVQIAVMGLKSGRDYTLRAVTRTDDGAVWASPPQQVSIAPGPEGITATLDVKTDGSMESGKYVMMMVRTNSTASTATIWDRDGDLVWWRDAVDDTRDAHTARVSRDRQRLLYGYYDQTQDDTLGGIYELPFDGMGEIPFTKTIDAHHDFRELPDGSFAYLGQDYHKNANVEGEQADIVSDVIYTQPRYDDGTIGVTQVWSYFEDSGLDLWWVCSHMEETLLDTSFHQWTHSNSLMLDPVDPDRYIWLLSRYQDALVKVDLQTRARVMQIGGRDTTVTLEGGAFSHPHMSQLWDGGFVLFNNNTHLAGNSTVQEWTFDSTKATMVHEWVGSDSVEGLADAVKLPNGNVLIAWSTPIHTVEERTADDEVVWGVTFPKNVSLGRVTLLDDLYDRQPMLYGGGWPWRTRLRVLR